MKTRGFEPIVDGVTILDTMIDSSAYIDDMHEYAIVNDYTVEDECVLCDGELVVTLSQYAEEQISREVDDFWNGLLEVKQSPYNDFYVVTGSLGLWNGRRGGICETFDNLNDALTKCAKDAYDIVVKYEDGAIKFENHHHDGVNYFEIYNLSYEDYDKLGWWDDDNDGDAFEYIKKNKKPISWEMIGQGA